MLLSATAAGFVTGAGLIIAIGAQNAFVLRQGLQRSHVGLVVAVCALGDIALILLGVGGIGALVLEWPQLLQVLRFGGAAFLGWYGVQAALRSWRGVGSLAPEQGNEKSRRRVLLACLAFTFLNPHVYLDTMVLVGSLSTRYPGVVQWAFGLGACIASVVWFSSLGFGARLLQPIFRNPKAWRVLDGGIAVFMLVLCGLLLVHPLH
ncbi:MAG: LysE/ArgO family amino acid transporter [Thauera sp.]|jgi:L-lysine exporter family protein LysE/ArgO|nr:LysE/ArgO family amino acid transporter [Thauera sp.]